MKQPRQPKKKTSIRRMLAFWFAVSLVAMLLLLSWTDLNYVTQLRSTYEKENEQAAASWSHLTESRLDTAANHIHETMMYMYTNGVQLRSGSRQMKFEERKKCYDYMDDKVRSVPDISCLFLIDTESGDLLFASNEMPALNVIKIKDYLKTGEYPLQVYAASGWDVETFNGQGYFLRIIPFGKYNVGIFSDISLFAVNESFHILGSDPSSLLYVNGAFLPMSARNRADDVVFRDDGFDSSVFSGETVVSSPLDCAGAELVLVVTPLGLSRQEVLTIISFLIFGVICLALFVLLAIRTNRKILQPLSETLTAIDHVKTGDLDYRITSEPASTEFTTLYGSFNEMIGEIRTLRIEAYDNAVQQQKDELTMLRAQIRPHFYLNALTTISNMTYQDRSEDIRRYLKSLASYVRYMLNTRDKLIPLERELDQIRSYIEMQQIRTPGSVEAYVGCADAVKSTQIPFMLVFTAVENTFKHAMTMYQPLKLMVQCEPLSLPNFTGCRVTVADNGPGFSPEALQTYSGVADVPEAKEHIGLSNISRTLILTYGRNDLLHLSNLPGGGARLEIWVPDNRNEEEETDEAADL